MDIQGKIVAQAREAISVQRFEGHRVEHDPRELADSLQICCDKIADLLGEECARIQQVGMATQRSSIMCWEKDSGRPITPVISWQDRRAWEYVESINHSAEQVKHITGLVLSPHYGASKLRWCLRHHDRVGQANKENNLAIGPLASFLVCQLTGQTQPVCDPANASRTQLWSRHHCDWSETLCEIFEVDKRLLPVSVPSQYDYGVVNIGKHTAPLCFVTGDQSAAIYAFGEATSDTAYINLGTGAFVQWPIGNTPRDIPGMLNSVVYQDSERSEYVIEGTVNGAGSALSWLAAQVKQDAKELVSEGIQEALHHAPPVFLNGISGLGSPYWVSDFESRFLSDTTDGLKAVAIIESIAFLIRENLQQMESVNAPIQNILLTGGLSSVDYLCQTIADVCAKRVVRSSIKEATSAGVVYWLTAPNTPSKQNSSTQFMPKSAGDVHTRYLLWSEEMNHSLKNH